MIVKGLLSLLKLYLVTFGWLALIAAVAWCLVQVVR